MLADKDPRSATHLIPIIAVKHVRQRPRKGIKLGGHNQAGLRRFEAWYRRLFGNDHRRAHGTCFESRKRRLFGMCWRHREDIRVDVGAESIRSVHRTREQYSAWLGQCDRQRPSSGEKTVISASDDQSGVRSTPTRLGKRSDQQLDSLVLVDATEKQNDPLSLREAESRPKTAGRGCRP